LRFEDVDLEAGVIRVERAYDPKAREYVEPKSKAGKRTTPIPAALRKFLMEQKMCSAWSEGSCWGGGESRPSQPPTCGDALTRLGGMPSSNRSVSIRPDMSTRP
jgi:hypothetical protein